MIIDTKNYIIHNIIMEPLFAVNIIYHLFQESK